MIGYSTPVISSAWLHLQEIRVSIASSITFKCCLKVLQPNQKDLRYNFYYDFLMPRVVIEHNTVV